MSDNLPNLAKEHFVVPDLEKLSVSSPWTHAPRILMLYGSLRARSFSPVLAEEAGRLLEAMGAEVRFFDPHGLPLPDGSEETHEKVQELGALAAWSEGMVWSPERHGAMSGVIISNQLDTALGRRGAPDARQDTCRHAGERRVPVLQCRQSNARPRTLDAHGENPEPVFGRQGVSRV